MSSYTISKGRIEWALNHSRHRDSHSSANLTRRPTVARSNFGGGGERSLSRAQKSLPQPQLLLAIPR